VQVGQHQARAARDPPTGAHRDDVLVDCRRRDVEERVRVGYRILVVRIADSQRPGVGQLILDAGGDRKHALPAQARPRPVGAVAGRLPEQLGVVVIHVPEVDGPDSPWQSVVGGAQRDDGRVIHFQSVGAGCAVGVGRVRGRFFEPLRALVRCAQVPAVLGLVIDPRLEAQSPDAADMRALGVSCDLG